jgi:hypothetical protein
MLTPDQQRLAEHAALIDAETHVRGEARTDEQKVTDWINHYPDEFLACRNQHAWPDLRPGKKLQRTRLNPRPEEGAGVYYLEQTCKNCHRVRWRLTGSRGGGLYSDAQVWHYRDPDGYGAPPGLGARKGDYMNELYRRIIEEFEAAARSARTEQDT